MDGFLYDVNGYEVAIPKSETVYRLILTLWNICVLRYGPQALPHTRSTLPWIMILHMVIGTVYYLPYTGFLNSLQIELAALLINIAFIRVALQLGRRSSRFGKALGALLGSDVIITTVGLLLMMLLVQGLDLQELWGSTNLLLNAWSFVVTAHIFRHVFSVSFGVGIIIAFALFFASLVFMVVVQSSMVSI